MSVTACVYIQKCIFKEFSGSPSRKAQGHLKKDADLLTYLKIPSDTGHISIDKEGKSLILKFSNQEICTEKRIE